MTRKTLNRQEKYCLLPQINQGFLQVYKASKGVRDDKRQETLQSEQMRIQIKNQTKYCMISVQFSKELQAGNILNNFIRRSRQI